MAGDKGIDGQLIEWVESGLHRDGRYSPDDVICGIRNGDFQLFRYPKGIVITQITGHDRVLVFLLSGFDFEEWKEQATEDLRDFAQGRIVEAYCRPGLEKSLKSLGWKKEQVVLRLKK